MSQFTSCVFTFVKVGPDELSIGGSVYFLEGGLQQVIKVEAVRDLRWANRDMIDEFNAACHEMMSHVERLFNKGEYVRDSGKIDG